jgi:hypothetical protein
VKEKGRNVKKGRKKKEKGKIEVERVKECEKGKNGKRVCEE